MLPACLHVCMLAYMPVTDLITGSLGAPPVCVIRSLFLALGADACRFFFVFSCFGLFEKLDARLGRVALYRVSYYL